MKRKFEIDCDDGLDIDEILAEVFEKVKGGYNCNFQYAKHAEKLKEAGKAKSTNQAAEIIAEETGESQSAVRSKIQRGEAAQCAQEQQQPENIEESKTVSEITNDAQVAELCKRLKVRIWELKRTVWNHELRAFVLDTIQKIVLTAAKN